MKRTIVIGSVLTISVMLAIAGCGSTSNSASSYGGGGANSSATPAATTGASLTIQNYAFSQASVKAGSTVTVTNKDSAGHTVNVNGTKIDVTVPGGASATFVAPATAGTYTLTCDFHPAMQGKLVVNQ